MAGPPLSQFASTEGNAIAHPQPCLYTLLLSPHIIVAFAMRPDGPRDLVTGPDDGPKPPFPLRLSGKVIKGFGRGSSEVSRDRR